MRAFHSTKNGAVAATLALFGLTSAAVVVRGFENGSFDEGFAGWQAQTASRVIGLGGADAQLGIDPLRDGETLAELRITVTAGTLEPCAGPGGAAVALARLQQDVADIPTTFLTFEWVAGLSSEFSGWGRITYQARLIVERSTPPLRHEFDLLQRNTLSGRQPYPTVEVKGGPNNHWFYTDLGAVGFEPGDDIRVAVEIQAQARALTSCDFASFIGTLMVDRFALRRSALVVRQGFLSASEL